MTDLVRHPGGPAYVIRIGRFYPAPKQRLEPVEDFATSHPPVRTQVVVHEFLEHLGVGQEPRRVDGDGADDPGAWFLVRMVPSGGIYRDIVCHPAFAANGG